ncbi:MAG TPA: SUF system NifU family Fe-S cluster assembly protein [Burkholderiales bacterium]|nr:SUF system NifU family Fe-S cluster assembly protein [Burkholderiales bacterium]
MAESNSLYNDVILDHIRNARNFREISDANRKAQGLNPLCGDAFTVYARIEGDRVVEASFQCECCGISMASASVMTEAITGRTVSEARSLYRHFERLLKEPVAPKDHAGDHGQLAVLALIREFPSRVNCALLGWQTLDAALDGRPEVTIG